MWPLTQGDSEVECYSPFSKQQNPTLRNYFTCEKQYQAMDFGAPKWRWLMRGGHFAWFLRNWMCLSSTSSFNYKVWSSFSLLLSVITWKPASWICCTVAVSWMSKYSCDSHKWLCHEDFRAYHVQLQQRQNDIGTQSDLHTDLISSSEKPQLLPGQCTSTNLCVPTTESWTQHSSWPSPGPESYNRTTWWIGIPTKTSGVFGGSESITRRHTVL